MEIILVSCAKCGGFIPDAIGDGSGIGKCKVYEYYKSKGVSGKELEIVFKMLGGKVFYKGTDDRDDRRCNKFKRIEQ
jgi:hypothetical protein